MKVVTTINGGIRVELQAETSDDRYVLELIKDKKVKQVSVPAKGDGSIASVIFDMETQP